MYQGEYKMIDYSKPFHVIDEADGEFKPQVSFDSIEEAIEFIKFAPGNYIIVTTADLEDFIDTY